MSVREVEIRPLPGLGDYEESVLLGPAVERLRRAAREAAPALAGRRLWMVNSTASGGGVAEMLPTMISLLRELGVDARWAVIGTDRTAFFDLTKRIHNLIHGAGDPDLTAADREVYEAVNRENAESFLPLLSPDDVVVIHDPQPLPLAPLLAAAMPLRLVWRCHIGLDRDTPQTASVWEFLEPYFHPVDQAVFTAREYVPPFLADCSVLIRPAIDPLSEKNLELSAPGVMEVLCAARMAANGRQALTASFDSPVRRLGADGEWHLADEGDEIGLLRRPIVTQISRWDRLKGFAPLLEAFARLKTVTFEATRDDRHRQRLAAVRLVLAGPDPSAVADDPEGLEVLDELCGRYLQMPAALQRDVALLSVPQNGLMVNALQRSSTVVVQNSLQEGFGLTATEAMWKALPVVASSACGLRQQIDDGVEGRLVSDPEDPEELAGVLDQVLADPAVRAHLGRRAQNRVLREFLVFKQLEDWLETVTAVLASPPGDRVPGPG